MWNRQQQSEMSMHQQEKERKAPTRIKEFFGGKAALEYATIVEYIANA